MRGKCAGSREGRFKHRVTKNISQEMLFFLPPFFGSIYFSFQIVNGKME